MFYKSLIRPILFQLDSEQAHYLAHYVACALGPLWPLTERFFQYNGDDLRVNLAGAMLTNPVGLAAGFDKNGLLVPVLGQLGFGFAEIGSVTAQPSNGNPKPRLFRLPADEALINRMGLNGDGADVVASRLSSSKISLPIGLNIAKTNLPTMQGDAAIEDILYTYRQVKNLPLSYLTINASCPNTEDGIMEETRELAIVLSEMVKDNPRGLPIFIKLSPDSSDQLLDDIVQCATKYGIAGYVCGNTSLSRNGLVTRQSAIANIGRGGMSGQPLKPLALSLLRKIWSRKSGEQIVIAVGGIQSGQDAYEFIKAGASALQIYTGLIYQGPMLPFKINKELSSLLVRDGLTIKQAIGLDA